MEISEHFQAILGCLFGEDWTSPRLVEMVITPGSHLLGRCAGEASFKVFLGASEDLIKNIHGVAPIAELDGDEIGFLVARVAEIRWHRYRLFCTGHRQLFFSIFEPRHTSSTGTLQKQRII